MSTSERWASFDCYGTLIDWETGMGSAISQVAPGNEQRLLRRYYEVEHDVESERFRPYREVLAETLTRAAAAESIALPEGGETVLADTLPDWPIYPDVKAVLGQLRQQGWRLAILSNIDRDMIAETVDRLEVTFDLIVTAEDVRSYKPAAGHFRRLAELADVGPGAWAHVACSLFHDIPPAREMGIPAVWVKRQQRDGDGSVADASLPDLRELPGVLERLVPSTG